MLTKLKFSIAAAFCIFTCNIAQAQTVLSQPTPVIIEQNNNHPIADGVGDLAHTTARVVGNVAGGVAQGIDDVAHSINPDPKPTVVTVPTQSPGTVILDQNNRPIR